MDIDPFSDIVVSPRMVAAGLAARQVALATCDGLLAEEVILIFQAMDAARAAEAAEPDED
jgi:hypothetical protein